MENPEVAQVFEEVADLLELQNANLFRVRAYRNAARTIRDLPKSLDKNQEQLKELPGIGAVTALGYLGNVDNLPDGPASRAVGSIDLLRR